MMASELQLSSKLPGILRLSPEIRRTIYLHAKLGPVWYPTGEELPRVLDLADMSGQYASQMRARYGFSAVYGLLLSCRALYSEASTLLYSTHWFIIHYRTRESLQPLRALSPHSLASLTNLRIVLNQASCHQQDLGNEGFRECCGSLLNHNADPATGHGVYTHCVLHHECKHDDPLERSTSSTKDLLADWHAAAAHLASHITPGKFELALICDLDHEDVAAAESVLAGLHLLPRLKDCHVRLCKTRHSKLQELAQTAALRARGIISSDSPPLLDSLAPRLVNLPREIRLRILEYTDLVTPWREVTWSRAARGGYRIEQVSCSSYEAGCLPGFHHGCQFIQCSTGPWPKPSVGCFCRRLHSAFSPRCQCWSPPIGLFLICRTLYLDASLVFYSRNRFIVIDGPSSNPFQPWRPRDYPYSSLAASKFLRHVVPRHCLGHLRFLELVFAPFTHLSRPRDEHPALQDWVDTLDWAKDKINFPALTLRVITAVNTWGSRHDLDLAPEMTRAQGKEVLATYNRIISPLGRLGATTDNGLARFYAQLAWPWEWKTLNDEKPTREEARERVQAKRRELKARAERAIMGDRYDRVCSAAAEPPRSVWNWSCLSHY